MNFKGIEICCPHCHEDLRSSGDGALECKSCNREYPIVFGIPDLRVFPDPYIDAESDRAKGLKLAAKFDELDFAGLIDFYYRNTPAVPKQDAQRYSRGLLAAEARAQSSLDAWESSIDENSANDSLLEIGCGTGALLLSAARRFKRVAGVDIAFRWLVVAKKRLSAAGLDVPLICACAEALPFRNESFDRVVADSTLEHLADQPMALEQSHRVMTPSGYLFVSTPNRFSLGPDPHVGIWSGSILPERLLAAYVRHRGGVPPKRHLLSARELSAMIRTAGFSAPQVSLPDISKLQRNHFGRGMQMLIKVYQTAKRIPVSRQCLQLVGPLLHAVAEKKTVGQLSA